MDNKKLLYSEHRLPDLIKSLKSQVEKNMTVLNRPVEADLSSDKFVNVLKGRKLAAEYSIKGMNEIDKLEQQTGIAKDKSYFKENLPILIDRLKEMFDLNLLVVDIDIDEEDFDDNLKEQIGDQIEEIFGMDIAKRIFKKLGTNGLSEDKFYNVIKARDMAAEDNQWLLKKIDELEAILHDKEQKKEKKKSWALEAAS